MRADDIDPTYRNNDNDLIQQRMPNQSRKPTITLVNLNKLKKMRAAKALDVLMRSDFLEIMYSVPSEEGGI